MKRVKSLILSVVMLFSVFEGMLSVSAENPDYLLFANEFNSDSITGSTLLDVKHNSNADYGDPYDTSIWSVANGSLKINKAGGDRRPALKLDNPVAIGSAGVTIEARVKYDAVQESRNEDGSFKQTPGGDNGYLFNLMDSEFRVNNDPTCRQACIALRSSDSTVAAGHSQGLGVSTGYKLYNDRWYIYTIQINPDKKTFGFSITDEQGNTYDSGNTSFTTQNSREMQNLQYIQFFYSGYIGTDVDYVRIYDTAKLGTTAINLNDAALDGQTNLPTSFDAQLTFEKPVTDAELNNIFASNCSVTVTASNPEKTQATVSFSGLANGTSYTLWVPMIGGNKQAAASFSTAGPDWLPFSEDFDGESSTYSVVNVKETGNPAYPSGSYGVGNGILKINPGGNTRPAVKLTNPVTVGEKGLALEIRLTYHAVSTYKNEDGSFNIGQNTDNGYLFNVMDSTGGCGAHQAIIFLQESGELSAGGFRGGEEKSDYKLYDGKAYTFEIHISSAGNKYSYSVTEEGTNRTYQSPEVGTHGNYALTNIQYIQLSYAGFMGEDVDYIRIMDKARIPMPDATRDAYEAEPLDGAGNVRQGEKITVSSEGGLDQDTIKLDGEPVAGLEILSGGKQASFTMPNIGTRTFHILKVGESEFKFRSADEGKYLYRAEFDGNDDAGLWYNVGSGGAGGSTYTRIPESDYSKYVKDGHYEISWNNPNQRYRAFLPVFEKKDGATYPEGEPRLSQKLDCTGKKNIVIETRLQVGEGSIDPQFLYLGDNIAMLKVDENRVLRYNAVSNTEGDPFMVNDAQFVLEAGKWYNIAFRFDFAAQKYQVMVDDSNGNIASSGMLGFIYNAQKDHIVDFRFPYLRTAEPMAPIFIDYFRIIDEDCGKVEVTYGDNVALEGSALIQNGDTFSFSLAENVDLSGITLKSEDGTEVQVSSSWADGKVTLTPSDMEYDTKYTLTIPAAVIGAESDQTVNFTTKWNVGAQFAYPAGYTQDSALKVAYFGGSITNMNGWRVESENWIKEKFPKAEFVNASVGGTGAEYGWIRLKRDVIDKNPDLVFVEFAVNDSNNTQTAKYMESIVRNLNKMAKPPAVIFVYTTVQNFNQNLYAIAEHERVAKAYGIPSISIHDYMQSRYHTELDFKTKWDDKTYLPDSTHPNTGAGSASEIYGQYVNSLMTSNAAKYFVKPKTNADVNKVAEGLDYVYNYQDINQTLDAVGEKTYTATFEGDLLLVEYGKSTQGGKFKVEIDNAVKDEGVDTYVASSLPNSILSYTGLGEGSHTVSITVLDNANPASAGKKVSLRSMFTLGGEVNLRFDSDKVQAGTPLTVTCDGKVQNGILMVVLYDANGVMTGIVQADISNSEVQSCSITPKVGDAGAKAFLWEDLDKIKPLAVSTSAGKVK